MRERRAAREVGTHSHDDTTGSAPSFDMPLINKPWNALPDISQPSSRPLVRGEP